MNSQTTKDITGFRSYLPDGPAGAFEQKLTVSLFVEHGNCNFLNVGLYAGIPENSVTKAKDRHDLHDVE